MIRNLVQSEECSVREFEMFIEGNYRNKKNDGHLYGTHVLFRELLLLLPNQPSYFALKSQVLLGNRVLCQLPGNIFLLRSISSYELFSVLLMSHNKPNQPCLQSIHLKIFKSKA